MADRGVRLFLARMMQSGPVDKVVIAMDTKGVSKGYGHAEFVDKVREIARYRTSRKEKRAKRTSRGGARAVRAKGHAAYER